MIQLQLIDLIKYQQKFKIKICGSDPAFFENWFIILSIYKIGYVI